MKTFVPFIVKNKVITDTENLSIGLWDIILVSIRVLNNFKDFKFYK